MHSIQFCFPSGLGPHELSKGFMENANQKTTVTFATMTANVKNRLLAKVGSMIDDSRAFRLPNMSR